MCSRDWATHVDDFAKFLNQETTVLASGLRFSWQAEHLNLLASSNVATSVSRRLSSPTSTVQIPKPAVDVVLFVLQSAVRFELQLRDAQGQFHRRRTSSSFHVHRVLCIASEDVNDKMAVCQLYFLLVQEDSGDKSAHLRK